MTEVMMQTAFLVIAILAVRKLFRYTLHAYVRYGLWLLVVLRLMAPFNFIDSPLSVLRVAGAADGLQEETLRRYAAENKDALTDREEWSDAAAAHMITDNMTAGAAGQDSSVSQTGQAESMSDMTPARRAMREMYFAETFGRVLRAIWLTGSVLVGGFLTVSHVRFLQKLRRRRTLCTEGARDAAGDCPIPVYRVSGLGAPCLVGIFRPAVYVGTELDADSDYFHYAVTHEKVHYLHGDHLWASVRAALVTVYWFHPLVWIAAVSSAKDGEIACDYGTIHRLGQRERLAYGEMLLAFSQEKGKRGFYSYGTMLRPRRSELKERILRLTKNGGSKVWAGALTALLMLVTAGCTFTGASADSVYEPIQPVESAEAETTADETENGTGDAPASPLKEPAGGEAADAENDTPQDQAENRTSDAPVNPIKESSAEEETDAGNDTPQEEAAAGSDDVNTEVNDAPDSDQRYATPCTYTEISDTFGERINPITQEVRKHEGIDYAAEEGSDVKAAADGVVHETGYSAQYGNYIVLLHANGDMTYYCNCQEILARKDEQVKCGDKIATVGQTGMATGPHLHFGLNQNGEFVDPQDHMQE